MISVGETLRRERLKQNLELDSISSQLKIGVRLLEAIEADQYDRLPGPVFARSFVRQYARLLKLDDAALGAQMQSFVEPEVPQFVEKSKPSVSPIAVEKIEEWRTVGDRRFRVSGPLSAAAGVVVVMLICSAVYAWMQRPRGAVANRAPSKVAAPAATPAPPARVDAPKPAPAVSNPVSNPITNPAAGPAAAATAQATPRGPVHVEIEAQANVWVLVRTDGKVSFSGIMAAHTKRTVDAERDVVLRLGNAGNVNISLNGKPVGPAGSKGQVRTVQLTSGGFQIVSAIPAAAADRL